MKGRGKRGKREEKSERARGKGKKKGKKGGEGEEKEKKMEEISLNGGEGFQEASWGVGNVFKKFEEYTPLIFIASVNLSFRHLMSRFYYFTPEIAFAIFS